MAPELSFSAVADEVRNWGRWGADDELGTLNLITADCVVEAARLVRRGAVFSLSIPVARDGPQTGVRRLNPLHLMTDISSPVPYGGPMRFSDDFLAIYSQSGTQWDALSHVDYERQLYNGLPVETITPQGAGRLAIDNMAAGVASRGVLLDVARLRGVDWLASGELITPDDLDAAAEAAHVDVSAGDIILLRTGWRRKFVTDGSAREFMGGEPGIGIQSVRWLHRHDVAAICSDNFAIEVMPGEDGYPPMSVHMLLIRDMGMTLGEIFDLEALAADCQADGVYEFFFCAPPLRISGGVGSPVNPLAIK